MDPASDRSYHPGDSRRGFSEVKSPSVAGSLAGGPADRRSRHSDEGDHRPQPSRGRPGGGGRRIGPAPSHAPNNTSDDKKTLESHLSTRNAKSRARNPYELDIESLDKHPGGAATWASRDWCAEARKSRMLLREQEMERGGMLREEGAEGEDEVDEGGGSLDGGNETRSHVPENKRSNGGYREGVDARSHAPPSSRTPNNHHSASDARSHAPVPNRRQQIQSLATAQSMPSPRDDDFSCLWNDAAANARPVPGRQGSGRSVGGRPPSEGRQGSGRSVGGHSQKVEVEDNRPRGKMPSRHSLKQRPPSSSLTNEMGSGGADDGSRGRSAGRTAGGGRSQSRGAADGRSRSRGPPDRRSRSRGPTNERGRPVGPPAGAATSVRAATPGRAPGRAPGTKHQSRSQSQSRSRSLGRPAKRLGCVGASTDMTRRSRSRARHPAGSPDGREGDHRSSGSGDVQGMESFEREMQGNKRREATERMNQGLRGSRGSSGSRGRSGRSRSRGRGPSAARNARSQSRARSVNQSSSTRSKSRTRGQSQTRGGNAKPTKSKSFHGRSATPETGPLSSHSGKSSRGSLLKTGSGRHRLGRSVPPSAPPHLDEGDRSRPATPNRSACDDATAGSHGTGRTSASGKSSHCSGGEEIATCLFDRKGCCVRHPRVRLRKRKMLGGWQVLIANCPDCCVEEMGRLQRARRKMKKKKRKEKKEKKEEARGRRREEERAVDGARSQSRDGRGKSRSRPSGARSKSRSRPTGSHRPEAHATGPIFEFDIPIGAPVHDRTSSGRSAKSGRSKKSQKSSSSRRSSKSGKSSRRSSKSRKSQSADAPDRQAARSVSRGARPGSAQRFVRQNGLLRVAKMPFADAHGREGRYTGEINEHGLPHGRGALRYTNGQVHEGLWEEGTSAEMDASMERAKGSGFGNWRDGTKKSKQERERRKEEDMEDLRSFISQSVRSGSVGGEGSQLESRCGSNAGRHRFSAPRGSAPSQAPTEEVEAMPWSDVNGFSGNYTGQVNGDHIPDGQGYMRYSNGVVEEGAFRNGVFQPPSRGPPPYDDEGGDEGGGGAPSSSVSVWSLKSSPTMALREGGHAVLTGRVRPRAGGQGTGGAPTSVHLGGTGRYGGA